MIRLNVFYQSSMLWSQGCARCLGGCLDSAVVAPSQNPTQPLRQYASDRADHLSLEPIIVGGEWRVCELWREKILQVDSQTISSWPSCLCGRCGIWDC